MFGRKTMQTKEVYSQFVSIHCPGFQELLPPEAPLLYLLFFGLTVLRSHFKCLSSPQEQSSSSLHNNLNSLTIGTIDEKWKRLQHALGYVESDGVSWVSRSRDFTFSETAFVKFVKIAVIWSNEWRVKFIEKLCYGVGEDVKHEYLVSNKLIKSGQ